MNKSAFNLDENIAAAIASIPAIIPGIVFLVAEKENKFVRFNAMQSILLGVLFGVVRFVLGLFMRIPILGFLIGIVDWALGLVLIALAVLLFYKAIKNETYKLPILGEVAENQVNK